jgi:TRAP-type C4-dicarboxylate transport system permease small subunit
MRAEAAGRWVENLLLAVLFGGLVLLAVAQILLRNVWSVGLPWADGLVRIVVLWLAILGAVAAARDHKHIAINLTQRYLPAALQRPAAIAADAFAAIVCGFLSWYSVVFVMESRSYGDLLLSDWPAWIFQAVMPIGFGLIAYRYALRCAGRVLGTTS